MAKRGRPKGSKNKKKATKKKATKKKVIKHKPSEKEESKESKKRRKAHEILKKSRKKKTSKSKECKGCGKDFKWEKRGRRPLLCPKCKKASVIVVSEDKPKKKYKDVIKDPVMLNDLEPGSFFRYADSDDDGLPDGIFKEKGKRFAWITMFSKEIERTFTNQPAPPFRMVIAMEEV